MRSSRSRSVARPPKSVLIKYSFLGFFFCLILVLMLVPTRVRLAAAPTLISRTNSTRAIAYESVTHLTEPFAPTASIPFGQDPRTRVMLFASNLTFLTGETAAAVTADAEDGN